MRNPIPSHPTRIISHKELVQVRSRKRIERLLCVWVERTAHSA